MVELGRKKKMLPLNRFYTYIFIIKNKTLSFG